MRILQIHPLMKSEALSPAAGGMAGAALHLTRLLVQGGHEVQVLPIPEGVGSRELWEVAPGRAVEVAAAMHIPGWRVKNIFYDSCALTALRREVQLFQPQVIHNHLARLPFPRLARALGLGGNLVLTHHHGEAGEGLDSYTRVVFPSQYARNGIAAQAGIPMNRTRCIYSPVSSDFCCEAVDSSRRREGVMYVGAVRRRKGIDLLLDAYRMEAGLRRFPLSVCGTGEDLHLVHQAMQEGLPVRWLGQLSQKDLAAKLLETRLVVMPSRLESFGIALLEAACSGVPVIGWAPTVHELEEQLKIPVGKPFDGRTQTASELAGLMLASLQGEGESFADRTRLAAAARDAFSEERYVAAYLNLYQELTGS
jgi:glycosyltransferase involved in cell wall biosynthesis